MHQVAGRQHEDYRVQQSCGVGIVGDLGGQSLLVQFLFQRHPPPPSALDSHRVADESLLHVIANSLLMVSARIHSTKGTKSKVIIGETLNKIHYQSLNTLIKGL